MPYFRNDSINLLLIHIPKTGGTSLETYFSKKYDILLDVQSLFSEDGTSKGIDNNISLQHQLYRDLYKNRKEYGIIFDQTLKIITIVRNPYERIISDLFWKKLIDLESTAEEVYDVIQTYVADISTGCGSNGSTFDNHNLPQFEFVLDHKNDNNDNSLAKDVTILKTESLTEGMRSIGYADFDRNENINADRPNYYAYLNPDSVRLINRVYSKDFELFGYNKMGDDDGSIKP